MSLTPLQLKILDVMMDDYEDIEQVYLTINREAIQAKGQPDHPLINIVDGILALLERGLVEPRASWKEDLAPVAKLNREAIHYYWFFPTHEGKQEWQRGG